MAKHGQEWSKNGPNIVQNWLNMAKHGPEVVQGWPKMANKWSTVRFFLCVRKVDTRDTRRQSLVTAFCSGVRVFGAMFGFPGRFLGGVWVFGAILGFQGRFLGSVWVFGAAVDSKRPQ